MIAEGAWLISCVLLVCRYLALYKGLVPKIMRLGPGENKTSSDK